MSNKKPHRGRKTTNLFDQETGKVREPSQQPNVITNDHNAVMDEQEEVARQLSDEDEQQQVIGSGVLHPQHLKVDVNIDKFKSLCGNKRLLYDKMTIHGECISSQMSLILLVGQMYLPVYSMCTTEFLIEVLKGKKKTPLFQSVNRQRQLSGNRMHHVKVFEMIKRRTNSAGPPETTTCHTFRATGITNYLPNAGSLENARAIATHESSQTTRLYDRSGDKLTIDEIKWMRI